MKTVRTPLVVLLGAVLGLLLAGCAGDRYPFPGTGAYPLDYFTEMHYQQSYRFQEPPRLYPPAGSVPTTGREASYTAEQAAGLANPVLRNTATVAQGQKLYDVNCAMCHGPQGRGDGTIAAFFKATPGEVLPADYTADAVKSRTDGELYYTLTSGKGKMPAFGHLLTPTERWTLVNHIRALQGK
ncbi:MAG: cytochrome c [Chloroflexi bacterium]|nr:cytochrome c [Chloroflexota bacterium]